MALFDFKKLDSIFHPQNPTPHPAETHASQPVSSAPVPAPKPAVPASAPAQATIPKATPVVEKPPVVAPTPAPHPTPAADAQAKTPAHAPTPDPAKEAAKVEDPEHRAAVTHQMEVLKEQKTILKPGDKGPNVLALQAQLKQLGLHVEQSGVMDKSTEGYVMALQTGGGLGADGVVGPKTLDQLLKLDQSPQKPAPGNGQAANPDNVDHMPDDPKLAAVYLYNQQRLKNAKTELNDEQKRDMDQFIKNCSTAA